MFKRRIWRAAATARNWVRNFRTRITFRPLTESEKRSRLITSGRRNSAAQIPVSVVEFSARSPVRRDSSSKGSILILQLAHIGDFVLSLRAAQKIRNGFPGAVVTLVCASWNASWAKETGLFDQVVAFDFFPRLNRDWRGPTPEGLARFEALGLGDFDIAVDLRHDVDTRPCLRRVRATARAGYFAPPEPGYPRLDVTLPPMELLMTPEGGEYSLHAELRMEFLAEAVVAAYSDRAEHPVRRLAMRNGTEKRPSFAILSVSAGDPIRLWPLTKFVEVGNHLIEKFGFKIAVVGGFPEKESAEVIVAGLPDGHAWACIDLPLADLASEVGLASLLIGLGSGVTHLAAALGTPTVGILSGVSPLDVWRPVGPRVLSLVGATPCSPCNLKLAEDCPFGVACLKAVSVERVLSAVEELLC